MLQQEVNQKEKTFGITNLFWKIINKIHNITGRMVDHHYLKKRVERLDSLYLSFVKDGEKVLTVDQHKSIDLLFSKYSRINHASHAFFTEKTGSFDRRYIPDSFHRFKIDRFFNDWSAAYYIDNKCYYQVMFQDVNIPKTIAFRMNGIWYQKWGIVIDYQQVKKLVMNEEECFVKKATESWGGLGVFYFQPNVQTVEKLTEIINSIPCDLVIQQGIKQSKSLAEINPDSVNTIRTMSLLRKDGTVKIYSSILRMGIMGAKVDNASSGGISTGIKPDGRLKDVAFSNEGVRYEEHPTSHVKFGSIVIPNFSKIEELVVMLHPRFPHFRLISWDIAVDMNDEPILIEANLCDGELDFHQLNNGPIFADDTERILSEIFQKQMK